MSTNPYTLLRTNVMAFLLANVADIEWCEGYNGQELEHMLSRVARGNGRSGAWIRCLRGTKDQDSSGDASVTLVEIYLGASRSKTRQQVNEAAEQLLWDVYDAVAGSTCNTAWLDIGLQYRDWETVVQAETGAIIMLQMATRFRMADWTAPA